MDPAKDTTGEPTMGGKRGGEDGGEVGREGCKGDSTVLYKEKSMEEET